MSLLGRLILSFGDDEAGLSNDLAEFASYLVDSLGSISIDKREELFLFVEACLSEGDEMVKDAIATCLLENLLNAVSEERIDAHLFVNLLGTESRKVL
ncbi:hypothetical protein P4S72_11190 [Vibrio sp. PP-XX7]